MRDSQTKIEARCFIINNMRIWHEQLISKLCQKHLNAAWNEGNTVYGIITCEKVIVDGKPYRKYCTKCGAKNDGTKKCEKCGKRLDGYFYHPAVKEFENAPHFLRARLNVIFLEMIHRGYHPKAMPPVSKTMLTGEVVKEWQDLQTQIKILKAKKCDCEV